MRKTTRNDKKIAPVIITVLVVLYVLPLIVFALFALSEIGRAGGVMTLLFLLLYLVLGGAVIVGVIRALLERLREIDGGEEEDASQY